MVVDAHGSPVGSVKGKYWVNVMAFRDDSQVGFVAAGEDGSFEIEGLTAGPVQLKIGYSGPVPAYEGETTAQAGAQDVRVVATR